jgi:glycosyltransferase involved in cell wall biosynthesis
MRASAPALAVLTYHRIGDPAAGPPGLMSATRRTFERQIAWLAASGRAVSLDDVLRTRDGGAPLPARAVLVTFDDAYADFATDAWPVLERHGVPAVLFVPTAFPGDPQRTFWWDRLFAAVQHGRGELATPVGTLPRRTAAERRRAYRLLREHVKRLPHERAMALVDDLAADAPAPAARVLTWPELRGLAAAGVALGAHSRTHPLLSRVGPERVAEEVAGSVDDLRRETGCAPTAFAYPGGDVPPGADDALRAAGVRIAFATAHGVNPLDACDWLALGRINVGRRTGAIALRARVAAGRPAERPQPPPAVPRPPRIAYVMSRFPKLSETFVLGEVLALERRGVPVDVYPLLRERAALVHPGAERVAATARYEPFLSPAIVASQLAWLRRRPGAYLGAWRDVLAETWGSPNFFVGAIGIFPKVAHMARRMQADGVTHVHCHFANHPAVAGLVVHRLTGIPFSFTAHGSDLHIDRRMLPRKVAEAAFVATVSHDNRRLILAECGDRFAPKVHVVRAGVDTRCFAPLDGAPTPPGAALRILCVGTLHEVKGQAHLVDACRLLADAGIATRCRLVGDGPDRAPLEARIRAAGLDGRVVLAGSRTAPEVAAELRGADVLVAPSVPTRHGRREGIPVVLMEAMSSGVPVVASAISGIPELVEDGVSGLLVLPGEPAAIAAALRRLAEDPALRARLGRAARARVLEEFDVEASADELIRRFGARAVA